MIPDRREFPRGRWMAIIWPLFFPLLRALFLFFVPVRIHDAHRVPRSGAFILVSNHQSWIDPFVLEYSYQRAFRWIAKREIFRIPLVGGVLTAIGCFGVNRGAVDRRALAQALGVLADGVPLGLFPEGHRSETGALIRGRAGVGYFAHRSGAPIIPFGVTGTRRARIGRFWRRDVEVRVGEPFKLEELPEAASGDQQAIADAIMRRIAALVPEAQRGEYARLD